MFTHSQALQRDRADGDPGQGHHLVSESRHHPADLAVLPFGEHHFHDAGLSLAPHHLHPLGPDLSFGQPDPLGELVEHLARGFTGDDHAVDLLDPEPRVGQAVGKLAVVGQQHQAGALFVESPDGVDPLRNLREQIDDLGLARRVAVRTDIALGLIHGEINVPLLVNPLPVHRDLLRPRVNPDAKFSNDLVVHRDPALEDHFLTPSTRPDPRMGEDFLEALLAVRHPLGLSGRSDARTMARSGRRPWTGRELAVGPSTSRRTLRAARAGGPRSPAAGAGRFSASTWRASFSRGRFLSHDDQSLLKAGRAEAHRKAGFASADQWTRDAPLRGNSNYPFPTTFFPDARNFQQEDASSQNRIGRPGTVHERPQGDHRKQRVGGSMIPSGCDRLGRQPSRASGSGAPKGCCCERQWSVPRPRTRSTA